MKNAFGPSAIRTAPFKTASGDIFRDPNRQMEQWADSSKLTVTANAIEAVAPSPTMKELDETPLLLNSARPLTHWKVAKHQEAMQTHQRS